MHQAIEWVFAVKTLTGNIAYQTNELGESVVVPLPTFLDFLCDCKVSNRKLYLQYLSNHYPIWLDNSSGEFNIVMDDAPVMPTTPNPEEHLRKTDKSKDTLELLTQNVANKLKLLEKNGAKRKFF